MKIVPIRIPSSLTAEQISRRVAQAIAESELQIKLVTTLAKYRGCLHWHIVKPGAKGTLELTYWPQTREAWFAVHVNRRADWIAHALPVLTKQLASNSKSKLTLRMSFRTK